MHLEQFKESWHFTECEPFMDSTGTELQVFFRNAGPPKETSPRLICLRYSILISSVCGKALEQLQRTFVDFAAHEKLKKVWVHIFDRAKEAGLEMAQTRNEGNASRLLNNARNSVFCIWSRAEMNVAPICNL